MNMVRTSWRRKLRELAKALEGKLPSAAQQVALTANLSKCFWQSHCSDTLTFYVNASDYNRLGIRVENDERRGLYIAALA